MNVNSVREYCLSFPQVTEKLQWGAELCFKVRGKIFTVVSLDAVPQGLCFKCTPETFAELCEVEGIRPAPYVGRFKWVLLEGFDVLRDHELEELIRQSYEMISAKTKSKAKPKSSSRSERTPKKPGKKPR
jgi:predicted DNA-binding protein (MmcQ/YjbR family)